MSAQRIDEVVLVNTEGSHRKAYRVWLEAEGALFHVGFAYGRIGAMLREGRKTTAPVARVTADALRAEIVREKEGRGYVQKRVTAPTAAANGHALPPKGAPKPRRPRAIASAHKAAVAIPVNRSGRTVISF
ncbi:MAG: hypothetical protein ACRC6L_06810 [Steroidobacteraceae bacterium]|jgi:beta-phosphoglucomutase-like phosphatase (HAD superfamily)